jgi:hypothetical protein
MLPNERMLLMLAALMQAFADTIRDARVAVARNDRDGALGALKRLDAMLEALRQQLVAHLGDTLIGIITKGVLGTIADAIKGTKT